MASDRLEKLIQQEQQLKARIDRERARLSKTAKKQRDGKLISWGVAVEQLLADETFKAEWWKMQCQRVLSGRTLERALVEELDGYREQDEPRLKKTSPSEPIEPLAIMN